MNPVDQHLVTSLFRIVKKSIQLAGFLKQMPTIPLYEGKKKKKKKVLFAKNMDIFQKNRPINHHLSSPLSF